MRVIREFLSLGLLFGLVASAPMVAAEPDAAAQPEKTPIQQVVDAGLMSGYPDGKFHPEGLLTRAELAHILVKAFKLNDRTPAITGEIPVSDVPATHWAYPDIQTVLRQKVMEGYREGLFYPNQKVNRAEAFAIFAQAYGVFSFEDAAVDEELAPYSDAGQIPDWARKAWATALHEGFVNIQNTDGRIYPLQPMTRGDMAYALSRYLEHLYKPAPSTPPTQ